MPRTLAGDSPVTLLTEKFNPFSILLIARLISIPLQIRNLLPSVLFILSERPFAVGLYGLVKRDLIPCFESVFLKVAEVYCLPWSLITILGGSKYLSHLVSKALEIASPVISLSRERRVNLENTSVNVIIYPFPSSRKSERSKGPNISEENFSRGVSLLLPPKICPYLSLFTLLSCHRVQLCVTCTIILFIFLISNPCCSVRYNLFIPGWHKEA